MKLPEATTDYAHGQMMGMLVIITLFENALETAEAFDMDFLEDVKRIAADDLAQFLNKPQEDVLLLVDEQLRKIPWKNQ